MRIGPVGTGAVAGLVAMLAAAPFALGALDRLDAAKTERARLAARLAQPVRSPAPLVPSGLAVPAENASGAAGALVARVRASARGAGVLVEEAAPLRSPGGGLAAARFSLSGSEKAVLALADAVEREPPLARFARWRVTALDGGQVRLDADAVTAWR